jgi:hypothetical protein
MEGGMDACREGGGRRTKKKDPSTAATRWRVALTLPLVAL